MNTRIFARIAAISIAAFSALIVIVTPGLADATNPTADIDGAADNALVKRYDGSFIVSYEKLAYTDFTLPLSALKPSEDPDARDKNNNRKFAPEKRSRSKARSRASLMSCRRTARRSKCCAIIRM